MAKVALLATRTKPEVHRTDASPSGVFDASDDDFQCQCTRIQVTEILEPSVESKTHPTTSFHQALTVTSKLRYETVFLKSPTPENEDDVVIATRAVGLNPIDWKSVDWNFCLPEFPWVTAREMSGVVVRTGRLVKDVQAGDRVWTSTERLFAVMG